jgi:hypothetical protein
VADWAEANNAEIAYTPTNSSWLNRHADDTRLCQIIARANVA